MKALFKKITKATLSLGAFACLLFGGVFAFLQTSQAKADTSLETEFENSQFEVTSYNGVAYEYVDGASAGLLAGYEGSVLKIDGSSGTAYVNVAFNGIKADSVESIVVKVYSPNYNATDSFRVTATNNASTIHKEYTVNMSAWTEITLTEDVLANFTQDGYLTSANFGVRARTGATYYIDSIIVNVKADLEADFTNNGQFALSQYSGLAYQVVNGAAESGLPAGYDGTVLKINGQKYSFVGIDFSAKQIKASDVESIVVRGYSPDYTADDEFRTIDTGLKRYVQYGAGAHDMSTWCDVSLNADSIAQMTDGNGYLSSIYLGLCDKGTVSAYFYIDSITVKMKEVELVYGEPTFEETTSAYVGAWEWNHKTDNAAVVKDSSYGYTIIGSWAIAANSENLAATKNVTSLSIKLNGETFYDLYQADDGYRLNSQLGYFGFSVPTAALVAGNGYEYPTIEIVNGTPFYDGNYLPETTIIYKDGVWQLKSDEVVDTTNYNPNFVSINSVFNNDSNGFLVVQFDTDGWAQGAIPTSYSGITYNGNDISDLVASTGGIKFFQEHSLWFTYSSTAGAKLVAGYNGYSHPTIKIAEGATVVYEEKTYTFHELVLYLVNDKWTTEQPDGWTDKMPTAVSYSDIAWNNVDYGEEGVTDTETLGLSGGALILITYSESLRDDNGTAVNTTNLITADSDAGNKIKINGVALKDVDGAYVCLVSGRVYIYVPTCEVLTIEKGTRFYDYALGEATFYFLGKWSDVAPEYTTVSFDHIEWNNYDYNNYGSIYGQENHAGTPSNGFCGLFAYSGNLGPVNSGGYTTAMDANMATAYLEIGCNLKVNGVAAKDIKGAYISYNAGQEYVYFYIPFSGLAQADVYTLTIEENTKFITAILPATTYYFYDGLFHENMPVVVTVQYGEITVSNRFSGSQTIGSEYLANALSNDAYSVCPLIWTIGGVEYYAGESVVVHETTTVVIVDAVEFETIRGAAVRISGDGKYGIRFESRIELDSYKALVEKYGETNIKTGTYIVPKALFDAANMSIADYFAQEKGEGAASKYVHISNFDVEKNANGIYNKDSYETDGYIRYFGSLTNLNDSNYYTQFFGVGYITITANDKTFTVYGLQDVMKTNRTIYDVATMAYSDLDEEYSDTEISVLKQYIDSVAVISYSNGNLFADTEVTGRDYTSAYSVEEIEDGFAITSAVNPKAVVVNGRKVAVEVIVSAGTYTFVLMDAYLEENFGSTLKYGLAEPNHLVWGGGSENGTDALLAGVAQQMGVSSYRIWTNGGMGGVSAGNVVSLGATHKASLKSHVKSLVDVGVNEILFVSCNPIMPYTYESYYVKDSNGNYSWISRETLLGGGYTHVHYDTVAVPDPTSEPEAYATWLKVQYDYYVLFAAEVEAWKTEFGWTDNTVKFYFEGLNEPEFQQIIHKKGSYADGVYTPAYFSTDVLAQVLTDVAYYMTLAVGDCGEVATPALTNISSNSGVDSKTGIYSDALLAGMYAKINDNVAPTAIDGIMPTNTNDENDYFTCLNWHPYLHWFKEENSKLYYGEVVTTKTWYGSNKKEAKVNESYADMWVLWNNSMYQIAVNGGDTDSPKVFFSEFGFCDWGNMTGSDNRAILGVNEELAATVFKTLMNKVGELTFVDELTVMAYRLFDIEELGAGEGNFGFINEQGQLKAIAKEYYLIINGNEDTSDLQAVIDEYFIMD